MADSFQVRATLNIYTTCNLGMASAVSLKSHYFSVLCDITIKNVFVACMSKWGLYTFYANESTEWEKSTYLQCSPHPTTAPWAKAAREKYKVSIGGTEGQPSLTFVQFCLSVLALDAEQHMSVQKHRWPVFQLYLRRDDGNWRLFCSLPSFYDLWGRRFSPRPENTSE